MAFAVIEDMVSSVEVVIFPSTFAECSHILGQDEAVVILGQVQHGERGAKIIAETVDTLSQAIVKYTKEIVIRVKAQKTNRQQLEMLKETFYQHHGSCPVRLTLHFDGRGEVDVEILKDLKIKPSSEFFHQVEKTLGYPALTILMKEIELPNRNGRGRGNYNHQTVH